MVKKLYPGGKARAFSLSYDDGVTQDIRFVDLLNKYGLKGTFNLNSELMAQGFQWIHECGLVVKRLSPREATSLYHGHEVASHTLTHPYMYDLNEAEVMHQLTGDKTALEQLFGREVAGFAVPFTYYSDLIAQCAQRSGFRYARISEERGSFVPPKEKYFWRAGIFHLTTELEGFVERFLATDQELALCQIAGHSYDLDVYGMWGRMEQLFQKISHAGDICPMTNIQLVEYLQAMEQATITDRTIQNPTDQVLWFMINDRSISVAPRQTVFTEE